MVVELSIAGVVLYNLLKKKPVRRIDPDVAVGSEAGSSVADDTVYGGGGGGGSGGGSPPPSSGGSFDTTGSQTTPAAPPSSGGGLKQGGGFKAPAAPRPNDLPIYGYKPVSQGQQPSGQQVLQDKIEEAARRRRNEAARGMKEGSSNASPRLPIAPSSNGMRQPNTFVSADTKVAPALAVTAPKFTPPTKVSVGPRVPMITVRPDLDPRKRMR
jgi:hypothetical protein